ncbi:Notoamide biosynthesis cluster O'-like protein [Cladobotryum mycophilum]|uniref:Notoamide biosynthesis cluster O'-like protein n=1 Tax=Cladobotryum mycophilum TaxID=491253 RepID=A0ABR0S6I8_9HYPO
MAHFTVTKVETSNEIDEVDGTGTTTSKPLSRLTRWFRSPLFNVIVVGFIAFTQVGIFSALSATGAGGQQKPQLVHGANSITYGIMTVGCSIFSILANKFGIKRVLILGTLGFAPYSASLYIFNRYGIEWFVYVGGVLCGLGASAYWAAEGAIAIGYADVKDRGKYTGIWLGLRELGLLVGSSIQLSLNIKNEKRGKVSYTTYIVLITLQCLGLPLALLVSPPDKVICSDGRKLAGASRDTSIMVGIRKYWKLLKRKQMYLLIPILVGFSWNVSYLGIYQTSYFSVRARTLNALATGVVASCADVVWGRIFDLKSVSRPKLAKFTWAFFSIGMLGVFSFQVTNEKFFSSISPKVTLDWNQPEFLRGFASMMCLRFFNESHFMFVYWIVGTFFDDLETLTLAVGIIRSFESIGACLSFSISTSKTPPMTNLIIAFVMFCITIPATSWAVCLVPKRPESDRVVEASSDTIGTPLRKDEPVTTEIEAQR